MKFLNVEIIEKFQIFFEPFTKINEDDINTWQSNLYNDERTLRLELRATNNICCPLDFEIEILNNQGKANLNLLIDGYDDVLEVDYDSIFKEYAEENYILSLLSNPIKVEYFLLNGVEKKAKIHYTENLDNKPYVRKLRHGLFGISHLFEKTKYQIKTNDYEAWIKQL